MVWTSRDLTGSEPDQNQLLLFLRSGSAEPQRTRYLLETSSVLNRTGPSELCGSDPILSHGSDPVRFGSV